MAASDENIRGGRELDAALQQLAPKLEKNILRAALRAGANVLKAEARANVPVMLGELRKSIRVTANAKAGTVTASVKAGNKAAYYWRWVEYGTAAHVIKSKDGGALDIGGSIVRSAMHPGAQAKPFMRPALDSKGTDAIAAVAEKIRDRLTAAGINVPAPEGE